jgi:hypothetical protein
MFEHDKLRKMPASKKAGGVAPRMSSSLILIFDDSAIPVASTKVF